jgi:uncharacterized membrane protein
MLQLLMLLLIIVGTYAGLTGLNQLIPRLNLSPSLRGRLGVAVFFIFTGLSHFAMPEEMAQMLPPSFPLRVEMIYVTGVLEILGAIGLLIPGLERLASVALILFLMGVLPANIYSALNYVEFGAHASGPLYLLARIPFQLFVMGWLYYFGLRAEAQPKQDKSLLQSAMTS